LNLGLEGRVALVGGASRGLGRAVAEELVAEGSFVGVCARESEPLRATADALGALALPADLSVEGEPARVVDACAEHFGRLDILVANAGGPPAGGFESFGADDWRRATALVLASTVELAAAAVPHMRRGGWGRILCITSIVAKRPVDNLLLSNALRPAVAGFAHSLAREVAKDGITVNTILPGYTRTERVDKLDEAAAAREGIEVDEVRARLEAEIPLGRLGEPSEFAATAAFLVSGRASYITGAAVPVDGGWLRGMF
jgi:3-oxoacyl-[acyl-carrier protein] reductase